MGELRQICQEYFNTMWKVESEKYDEEFELMKKEFEINELNIAVNDLRGKFIKPTLKKVSKYENKFAKLQKKASEFSIRTQLKTVKKKEFAMDEGEAEGDKKKPGWALGAKDGEGVAKSGSEGGGLNQDVEEKEVNDGEVEAGGADDVEPPEAAAEVDKDAVEEEVGEMADVAA